MRALERTRRMYVPAYSMVRSIKQLIMKDYIRFREALEVTWKELLKETRVRCGGYDTGDIARLVAKELSREGIKIW